MKGIRKYYTEIGIITTINNMNCAVHYAGSKKCHEEKENNKPHFGMAMVDGLDTFDY